MASREITVFTVGDAHKLSTWSNVPYFFTKNLEAQNIKVNRVNIEENAFLNFLYKFTFYVFLKVFYKNSSHTYFRSGLNYFLTNLQIRKALKKYGRSDTFVFLTYSFGAEKIPSKKIVLFSDWSYLYLISNFMNRKPYWFEKNALKREEQTIHSADLVLSLFPGSKDFNNQHYSNAECLYLGNVINAVEQPEREKQIRLKTKSKKILFIGNRKYVQGALNLINAFKKMKGVELHLIGLNAADTGIVMEGLFQHGYLDKGNKKEKELYYQLLSSARLIVNTNPDWGAFSAMTEAMYFYTPVITTPYDEFVKTYGETIEFGYYVKSSSEEELYHCLEKLMNLPDKEYINKMDEAHEKVKSFTWEAYTEKLLKLI